MGGNYYADKLNDHKLFQVYDTQIARVKNYLTAEIDFVKKNLSGSERVLELGAGYGRIMRDLAPCCAHILGIDISQGNVKWGNEYLKKVPNARLQTMDVHEMKFSDKFDVVLCLQNGLSAMAASSEDVEAMLELLAPKGKAFFSSYSGRFWETRVQWFQEQAAKGLLGELDLEESKDGVIVCKDGFRAVTHSPDDFRRMGEDSGLPYQITEVDESSVFLVIQNLD